MVEEAQGLRARVLADLARRRKVLHAQIEQLRAGRERLTETVQDVRRSIDTIAEDLFAAEDNARLAAEEAGRQAAGRPDEGTPEEVAALLLAEEAEAVERGGGRRDDEGPVRPDPEAPNPAGGRGREEPSPADNADDESPVDALFAKIRAAHEEEAETEPGPGHPTMSPGAGRRRR